MMSHAFPVPDARWEIGKYALLNLRARSRHGRTEIEPVARRIPYQWLGAHYQDHDDEPFVLLQNSGGGFVEGDVASLHVHVEADARVLLTTASAAKFYKCENDGHVEESVEVSVADGALLEYLPDEAIPFTHSRVIRNTRIHLADSARLFATDLIAAGRINFRDGESFAFSTLRSEFEVRIDGQLLVLDRLLARTPREVTDLAALWAGHRHLGLIVAYAPDLPANAEDGLQEDLALIDGVTAGVSRQSNMVCIRLLADQTWQAHQAVFRAWEVLRPFIAGKAARPIRKS